MAEVEREVEDAIGALREGEGTGKEPVDDVKEDFEEESEETPTLEELAQDLGWKTRDEFQGHDDDYIPPEKYIRNSKDIQASMGKHLKENKRELASLKTALNDLKVHYQANTRVLMEEHEDKLAKLREQRIEAIEEGDRERVDDVESKMAKMYENAPKFNSERDNEPELDPEEVEAFENWKDANTWYSESGDAEMIKYADNLAVMPEIRAIPYVKRIEYITSRVKEMYPYKFKAGSRAVANPVEGPSLSRAGKNYAARDLDPETREVMRNLVASGVMTQKEFINDLRKQGVLR
jgi:hypothetical protein